MIAPFDWLSEYINLPDDRKIIENAFSKLGFEVENINNDFIEIEVTPNRSDMLSILGIARELSIKFNNKNEVIDNKTMSFQPNSKYIDIKINEKKEVINFGGLIVKDIHITSSPEYIKKRLISCNINPINNIVDITNYLMIETGQPLHAFDLNSINSQLILRKSCKGDTITLLDGKKIVLEKDLLIYESEKQIVDLIGIMGAKNSSITDKTKNIFIQAAIFKPNIIRYASKSCKTSTPASYRYERGIDEQQTRNTIIKIKNIIENNKWGEVKDIFFKEHIPSKQNIIPINYPMVNKLIGTNFQKDFCQNALESIGCKIKGNTVIPPSHRKDILIWQDLAEETARIYGYDKLTIKLIDPPTELVNNKNYWKKYALKKYLTSLGFCEISTYSFLSEKETKIFENDFNKLIKIKNPLSSEHISLRNSLKPLLIKTASKNPWHSNIMLFEIGNIFSSNAEEEYIALLSYKKLNIKGEIKIVPENQIYSYFKIKKPLYVYESRLKDAYKLFNIKNNFNINELELKPLKYKSFSNYHPTVIDLSIIVDKNIDFETIKNYLIKQTDKIFDIDLFDKFENKNFGENKISYAFHVIFDNQSVEVINKIYQELLITLKNKFKAIIR